MFEELDNSDLKAVADARATRKFLSRKILLYVLIPAIPICALGIALDLAILPLTYLFAWGIVYIYVTVKVSDKIYKKMLESRK